MSDIVSATHTGLISPSTSNIILKVYFAPPVTCSIFIKDTLPLNFDSAGVALGNRTFSRP